MATNLHIPEDYEPIDEILFCNNRLSNTRFIIEDNGFYPLLLGKGEFPKIWLYALANRNEVMPVVENNESKVSNVKVDHYPKNKRISVSIGNEENDSLILDIHYNEVTEVVKIDLRPLGYNIVGNKNHLEIGGIKLKNNNFSNMNSAIGLGKKEEQKQVL